MYKLESLEKSLAKISIEVKGEEFKEIKETILKEFKNAKIDGFRKGHAPLDVVEKTFEAQIREELINEVLKKEYLKAIKEQELEPLGELTLEDLKVEKDSINLELSIVVMPKFELPQYKGLDIALEVSEVKEEDVEKRLEEIAARSKTLEKIERTKAEYKDIANISFEGFVDGVAFAGGKAEGYDLTLGSNTFVDTFEEQIVGHEVNDKFDVNVTFPEEYHSDELKGKAAIFKVKLNALKEEKLPEINDEFAKANGYDSLADYKIALKAELESFEQRKAEDKKYETIADKMVTSTEMEIPENMIELEANGQRSTLEQQLSQQGGTIEQYLKLTGKSEEELEKEIKIRAEKIVKFNLILNRLAKAESIRVEDADIEGELNKLASMYGMNSQKLVEELKKAKLYDNYMNEITGSIFITKVREFLVSNN